MLLQSLGVKNFVTKICYAYWRSKLETEPKWKSQDKVFIETKL